MSPIRSMRRMFVLIGIALLIALLSSTAALAAKPPSNGHGGGNGGGGGSTPTPTPVPGPKVVCLDAGHGGSDPGALGGGLQEKDLTLQIAGILSSELQNHGYAVIMTRTTDVSLTNTERAEICNGSDLNGTNPNGLIADAVIAIHLNAASDPTIDYFQAFWGKKNKDLAFSKAITSDYVISAADGSGNQLTDNAVGQFASGVLLKSNAPATLAETVFLSNTDEQVALQRGITNAGINILDEDWATWSSGTWDGSRQAEIAGALDRGIEGWLGPAQ